MSNGNIICIIIHPHLFEKKKVCFITSKNRQPFFPDSIWCYSPAISNRTFFTSGAQQGLKNG